MSADATTAGFLVVDKPYGWTSSDVVRKLKSALRLGEAGLKIGHCGTLDPMATGVLPISIGVATRFSRYVLDGDKSYLATVTLGIATDTYDAEGEVTGTADSSGLTRDDVDRALASYIGEIDQVPPAYSAVKMDGRRAYSIARSGGKAELSSRRVRVDSLEVLEWDSPRLTVRLTCGKGFYVRSFAHDLGIELGCGAHLSSLTRTRSGVFDIGDAVLLDNLVNHGAGGWIGDLHAIDTVLRHLPSVRLSANARLAFMHGNSVGLDGDNAKEDVRVYSEEGALLGLGDCSRVAGKVSPTLVIA